MARMASVVYPGPHFLIGVGIGGKPAPNGNLPRLVTVWLAYLVTVWLSCSLTVWLACSVTLWLAWLVTVWLACSVTTPLVSGGLVGESSQVSVGTGTLWPNGNQGPHGPGRHGLMGPRHPWRQGTQGPHGLKGAKDPESETQMNTNRHK